MARQWQNFETRLPWMRRRSPCHNFVPFAHTHSEIFDGQTLGASFHKFTLLVRPVIVSTRGQMTHQVKPSYDKWVVLRDGAKEVGRTFSVS